MHLYLRWRGLPMTIWPFLSSDTSRRPKDSEREGQGYSFVSRGEMEADIRAGRYLEHGEYEGNLYGTRIDSIRGVVAAGKVCVLDVNPQVSPDLLLLSTLLPSGLLYISPGVCLLSNPMHPLTIAKDPATQNTFLSLQASPTPLPDSCPHQSIIHPQDSRPRIPGVHPITWMVFLFPEHLWGCTPHPPFSYRL